jgi:Escherichia/Staphylococcus phage prohead protease
MTTTERRSAQLEVRARGRKLEGYAALFNVEANIGDFVETIAPGAFNASLSGDVLALVDHDPTRLLARTKSGSLRLSEDSKGLAFEVADVPNTTFGNDILELVRTNNAGGMSFGFKMPKGGESWDGNNRTLRNVELVEISIVSAHPAYPDTSVAARSRPPVTPLRLIHAKRYLETL